MSAVDQSPTATLRYWAAARAATGVDVESVTGSSVGEVLTEAVRRHPQLAAVVRVATVLLDGRAVQHDEPLAPGVTLELLPPFAGG